MRYFLILLLLLSGCAAISTKNSMASSSKVKVAVFDIDGTLTPKLTRIHTARVKASAAVRAYANTGYRIIYLSARFPLFQYGISKFLADNNFPEGDVQVPSWGQAFMAHDKFKISILRQYRDVDWSQSYGFGDSSTDYMAYSNVDIPQQHIIGLQRKGETKCETGPKGACIVEWTAPLPGISQ